MHGSVSGYPGSDPPGHVVAVLLIGVVVDPAPAKQGHGRDTAKWGRAFS